MCTYFYTLYDNDLYIAFTRKAFIFVQESKKITFVSYTYHDPKTWLYIALVVCISMVDDPMCNINYT